MLFFWIVDGHLLNVLTRTSRSGSAWRENVLVSLIIKSLILPVQGLGLMTFITPLELPSTNTADKYSSLGVRFSTQEFEGSTNIQYKTFS